MNASELEQSLAQKRTRATTLRQPRTPKGPAGLSRAQWAIMQRIYRANTPIQNTPLPKQDPTVTPGGNVSANGKVYDRFGKPVRPFRVPRGQPGSARGRLP